VIRVQAPGEESKIIVKLPVRAQLSIDDLKDLSGYWPWIVVIQAMY
jgi:hypothetical protein